MDLSNLLLQNSDDMIDIISKCFSIATGTVKKNWEEKQPGRVLVEMPYGETGKSNTEWLRVMQPYCGKDYGDVFIPEIGAEVVLGYVHGDINNAIVLGCLWNDTNKMPSKVANKDNSVKSIKTKGGHEIIFDETKDKEKIQIKTKGKLTILMEDKEKKISIKDEKGDNMLLIDSKNGLVSVNAKKKIVFKAGNKEMLILDGTGKKVTMAADNIDVKATQALNLKGQNTKLEGGMVTLKAQSTMKAEASAMMQIKGAMVKIN